MPLYQIQGPDGRTYEIEGPPGATRDEVIQAIMAKMPPGGIQAPAGTKNPLMGVLGRTAGLAAAGVEAVAEVAERAGDFLESKIPLSNIPQEQIKSERQLKPLFNFADSLRNAEKQIGYSPSTKLSELADNPLNAIPFIAERVITSTPDMAAAVFAFAPYIGARTKEILDERVKNDNKTLNDATVGDVTAAAGAAIAEATLERFATKRLGKGAEAQSRTGRLAKETGVQGGTEAIEEGAAYLGETAGTVKGVDPKELGERMLEGAIVGGGLGGGVQATREVLGGRKETPTPEKEADLKQQAEQSTPERIAREQTIEATEPGMAEETEALRALGLLPKEEPTVTPPEPRRAAELELEAPPEIPTETRPYISDELPPEPEEITGLKAEKIAAEKDISRAMRDKGPSLATVLRNRLSESEVFDISPEPGVAKVFRMSPKRGTGENIADVLANTNQLDDFLDPELKAPGRETEAVEYIKDKIRNQNYLTFETDISLQKLNMDLAQIEEALARELSDEQLRQKANEIAAEIAAEEGPRVAETAPEIVTARGITERITPEGEQAEQIITRLAAPSPEERAIADRERELFNLQEQIPEREGGVTGDLFGSEGIAQIRLKKPTGSVDRPEQLKLFNSDTETITKPSTPGAEVADDITQKESKIVEQALTGKTPLEAAKWLSENAPQPDHRLIAKRVADRMQKLMDAGVKFELNIAKVGDRVPVRLLNSRGISVSNVDTKTGNLNKLSIWLNDNSNPKLTGTTYDIVLHELIHSVTQGSLFLGRTKKFVGTQAADLAKRLNDVSNAVIRHYNTRVKAFKEGKGELTDFETRIYKGANYLDDADEILAWSMTSQEMQKYMEAIPYKNTSVWDEFVKAIRQFLGLSKANETTLSEVLGLSSELLTMPIMEVQNVMTSPGLPIKNNDEAQIALFARTNVFGQAPPQPAWGRPDDTKTDDVIFYLQDKQIDTKRVIEEIEKARGRLQDRWNAYLQEELYHGRTAKKTNDFIQKELSPLLKDMKSKGFTVADLEEYLHNRHAQERNEQVAKVNPNMPDGGSGILTADAKAYLAALSPAKRKALDALGKRINDITDKTRKILVDNGLEEASTIQAWESAYKNYVPLNRAEDDYELSGIGKGVGKGFSVRGPTSKRATGSSREVVDILANIAMQRERAIVRSEKSRVSQAIYGLAIQHPNPDFWLAIDPDAVTDPARTVQDLQSMGINPKDAANIMAEPTQTYVDPNTGLVTQRINPALRGAENVLAVRVNGKDKFVFFNTKDPRAARMAEALKNLDADELGTVMSMVGRATRYFAAVNTQYNPIFGVINFLRDYQGAALNLTTTPIAGETKKVMKDTWPALMGIYADLRKTRKGQPPAISSWAKLWEEFQQEGGQTGFRDQFSRSQERSDALEREIKRISEGKAKKAGRAIFDWLSDYNETMENAVRLAAYKAALDKGLSKQQAASVAKNLTVNFNRKGQVARQANALYAFFNASVQGTARMYQTLRGPAGKKIFYGGLLLGSAQALLLAAAGFDEDEPPDFVKERNIVIPTGGGKYITIPMPLGFNVIPNTSRILTEWFMSGGKDTSKRIAQITGSFLEMFNPIGNAGWSFQTFAPTVADPAVALFENKDWTGKPIAKKDVSSLDPTPGYTRAKDTASWFSKNFAEFLNYATGGTKYRPGILSPTPDQIDYLIGQATGGVGREIMKAEQTITSAVTGEELPTYKIPLIGRFIGETKSQAAQRDRFYNNIRLLNEHENEIKGRRKNREPVEEYIRENPESRLFGAANGVERTIQTLRRRREDLIEKNAPKSEVQAIEKRITELMTRFNEKVAAAKEGKSANR